MSEWRGDTMAQIGRPRLCGEGPEHWVRPPNVQCWTPKEVGDFGVRLAIIG
jgi:hypothetical protein